MFFDMDSLKRRNSKPSNGNMPAVFVTVSPELEKRNKTFSRSQRKIKIAIMGKSGVGKSGKSLICTKLFFASIDQLCSIEFGG
jgi:predicted GTPase